MRIAWTLLALGLAACTPNEPPGDTVTWYGDVEPVVFRVCANCHSENGIAPGNFQTYDGIEIFSDLIKDALESGQMPPPVSDPSCNSFIGDDHVTITDEERAMILQWIEDGTPKGDATEAIGNFEPSFEHLDDTDLVLQPAEAYTLQPDASGNQYRCFVLDYVPDHDFMITAFDVQIDNPEVVHHMLLFRDPNGDAGQGYGVEPGTKSFDCMDPIMESDWEPLHAWAPGMPPTLLPEGSGLKLHTGDQIVLQVHYYHPSQTTQTDRSAYALRTSTESMGEVYMYPGALPGFRIPAGDPAFTHERMVPLGELPFAIDLYGVFPHMHLLGTHYAASVIREDGTEDCVVDGDWDFQHQMSYQFREPVLISPSDTLRASCTWDNSADNPNQVFDPPQQITWGEGTDEEMCVFLLYLGKHR